MLGVGNGLECGSHGHFGFSVADVAANQAIHRQGRLHVALDVRNGGQLIRSFVILKRLLKFLLPFAVGRKCILVGHLPLRIQFQEFLRHVANRTFGAGLARNPSCAAELIELRSGAFRGRVFLNKVQTFEWDV